MFCQYISLDSFPRNAGAIPFHSLALYLALGRRPPPCLISTPLLLMQALSLAQSQGWRRLCTKNSVGAAQEIPPARSGRESRRAERNSAGVARKRTPEKCERQRRGSTEGGTGKRNRNRWRSALRRLFPPPSAGALPTLCRRSCCATPASSPALHRRPCPCCSRALRSTTLALSPALCQRSTLHCDGALHWATRALYAGPGVIPFAS